MTKTHYTLNELRKRGWTDQSLYLLNDYWELKLHKGKRTWMIPCLDAIRYEGGVEFLRSKPKCPVRDPFS